MRSSRAIDVSTGLFVLLGFAAIVFLVTQITNREFSLRSESYRLQAQFENVGGLKAGAPVSMAGVTVGRVVSTGDRPLKLAVSVDYWVPDGHYQLAARNRAGEADPVGTLEVTNGRGTWTGSTPAVPHPVEVELVDQGGNIACRGRLA